MIKAAFFDVDGTVLSHKTKSVPESTRNAIAQLQAAIGDDPCFDPSILCPDAVDRLVKSGALFRNASGHLQWCANVHAPRHLDDVKPMLTGDWYE